jgi:uncharacterized membrane protein
MLGFGVETVYFDFLQFLYHFALAILVGGSLVLGTAVAPALFATARSRSEAGTSFGAVLARFDGLALFSLLLLAISSVLKAGFEVTGVPEPRLIARWATLFLLAVATLYSSGWANPVARAIRAQTPGFDDLPTTSPARAEFARLHERSRRAMSVAVVLGLVALFLS